MAILLPSEQDPEKHEKETLMAWRRQTLYDLLWIEHNALCKTRDDHWEKSVQFERAQNRYEHMSNSYGEKIKEYNEKLDWKQLDLF